MKNSRRILTLCALGTLGTALAGCVTESGGGGVGGAGPAPAPVAQYQRQWLGTAPFCAAQPGDCAALGAGWTYTRSHPSGNGTACTTGTKVQCSRQIN